MFERNVAEKNGTQVLKPLTNLTILEITKQKHANMPEFLSNAHIS